MVREGAIDVFSYLYKNRMVCAFMLADGYAINFEAFPPYNFVVEGSEPVFYLFLWS